AEIAPSLGNNCFVFRAPEDVLEPVSFADFKQKPTSYGIPILCPFPNRVSDGHFFFGGEQFKVEPPRHGFVRDKPWRVEARGASSREGAWVKASFDAGLYPEKILRQFPFPFYLEVTYRLKDARLEMETLARNAGEKTMPMGFGIHPYFRRPVAGTLTVPAGARWELADSLPTGEIVNVEGTYDLRRPANVSELKLDDIYTRLVADADGLARCVLEDKEKGVSTVVEFEVTQFPHVVVYTPPAPRRAICVEPNTCPTDAFNLEARGVPSNVIALGPGESVNFKINISSRRTT
ncbi:MAG: aldose 1-epimerase, partial [Pyrinomonadaceae bacterium]